MADFQNQMNIDQRAIVSPDAKLGNNVRVGPFSIIESDVIIGEGAVIASSVLIASGSRIGENCRIFHSAVIGTIPQDLKFEGEYTTVSIGNNTIIREFCTINRGTADLGTTTVGSDCLLMAYSHVAHDCILGDNVILANAVNMAGHVKIDESAIVGGMVPIHQFVHIGKHTFIGGGFRVDKDVPPYILAAGQPLGYMGLNSLGLRRRKFSRDTLSKIKSAYKIIYQSDLNMSQALAKIKTDAENTPEVMDIYSFLLSSGRGSI